MRQRCAVVDQSGIPESRMGTRCHDRDSLGATFRSGTRVWPEGCVLCYALGGLVDGIPASGSTRRPDGARRLPPQCAAGGHCRPCRRLRAEYSHRRSTHAKPRRVTDKVDSGWTHRSSSSAGDARGGDKSASGRCVPGELTSVKVLLGDLDCFE